MSRITLILLFCATLALAQTKVSSSSDTLITQPTKEQLAKATPLHNTICPIAKEKIGSMGKPIPVIYKGKIINLCCQGCVADFAKNPAKHLKFLEESTAPVHLEKAPAGKNSPHSH